MIIYVIGFFLSLCMLLNFVLIRQMLLQDNEVNELRTSLFFLKRQNEEILRTIGSLNSSDSEELNTMETIRKLLQ